MISEAQKRYRQSEKGKEAHKRAKKKYAESEKGIKAREKMKEYLKEYSKKYYESGKGKEAVKKYYATERGKEAQKNYRQTSEVYRQRHLEAVKRYNEKKKAEKLAMKGGEQNE